MVKCGVLALVIAVILGISLYSKNKDYERLSKEYKELEKELREVKNKNVAETKVEKITETREEIKPQVLMEENSKKYSEENIEEIPKRYYEEEVARRQVEETPKNVKEQKNIAILITGAICIVLAAITFLMSTWAVIPNVLKTAVLVLLTAVFYGGSYVAKEKFKLEKAGQAFFYIAMAYMPICLLSISIFKLFGEYLSIFGEGKYIYFASAAALMSMIYYITYSKNDNKYVLYGSILSQMLGVISVSLILSNDVILILISLLLYNVLLMILTKKDLFAKIYSCIPIIITLIIIGRIGAFEKSMISVLALLAVNFLILEIKNKRSLYAYMFNILTIASGMYSIYVYRETIDQDTMHILTVIYVLVVYIIEKIIVSRTENKGLLDALTITTLVSMAALHIESFLADCIVRPYMIAIIQIILLGINYITSKKTGKYITAILIPMYFISADIDILYELGYSYNEYILIGFLTFAIGEFFRKKDKFLHMNIFITSNIFIVLMYIIALSNNFDVISGNIWYAILLLGAYVYSYIVEKRSVFKYLSYISFNILIYAIMKTLNVDSNIICYIPMAVTLIEMAAEMVFTKLQDEFSKIYLRIAQMISFIPIYYLAYAQNIEVNVIFPLVYLIVIIGCNMLQKKDEWWNVIPLTCAIPLIFSDKFNIDMELWIMFASVITTTAMSLKQRKISAFTVFSGLYLLATVNHIESIYIKEGLFICWALAHVLCLPKDKIERDIFKFLTTLFTLLLYNYFIYDNEYDQYVVIQLLGYIGSAIYIIRGILVKYFEDADAWEYIIFGIIYIIGLCKSVDVLNGITFGGLLTLLIMLSYIKKYGALFMISICALLINVIILTREFWYSIPWWAYLVIVGGTLIGFSIKNEVSENKTSLNLKEMLKNLKDRIEK